jgi:plastocyanin
VSEEPHSGTKGMQLNKARTLRVCGALAALGALAVVGAGGAASASAPAKAKAAKITMNFEDKEFFFEGPESVEPGQDLKVVNNTDPRKVGPHTFSLVNRKELPKTPEAIKNCERKFKGICGAIIQWHEVDLDTGEVGRNPVEVGKRGWNQQGNLKRTGDSWVSEKENQKFSQKVSAPEGKTLHFFCAVHASMQGKIRVEAEG